MFLDLECNLVILLKSILCNEYVTFILSAHRVDLMACFRSMYWNMKVWELDKNGRNWNGIKSLPELICRKIGSVCYHNYEHIYCFWHQRMICVCCYTWPEVLYYKVERRTWHWLPKCPSLPSKWSCGFK